MKSTEVSRTLGAGGLSVSPWNSNSMSSWSREPELVTCIYFVVAFDTAAPVLEGGMIPTAWIVLQRWRALIEEPSRIASWFLVRISRWGHLWGMVRGRALVAAHRGHTLPVHDSLLDSLEPGLVSRQHTSGERVGSSCGHALFFLIPQTSIPDETTWSEVRAHPKDGVPTLSWSRALFVCYPEISWWKRSRFGTRRREGACCPDVLWYVLQ